MQAEAGGSRRQTENDRRALLPRPEGGSLSPGSRGWQRVDLTRLRRGLPLPRTPLPLPTKEERTGSGDRYDNELECKGLAIVSLSLSLSPLTSVEPSNCIRAPREYESLSSSPPLLR